MEIPTAESVISRQNMNNKLVNAQCLSTTSAHIKSR